MKLGGRAWTWLFFAPSTVASVLFAIVSIVTFANLAQVQYDDSAGHAGSTLNGVMAATFLAPFLTAGLILLSFFVLVKKSWSRDGAGFTYGLCTGWFLCNSMFLLLTGVSLTAAKHYTSTFEASPKGLWTSSSTSAFVATQVLAFIVCAFHLVQAIVMISNRRSFGSAKLTVDELGLSTRLRGPGSPGGNGMAGAPAAPYSDDTRMSGGRSGQAGAWSSV